MKAESKAKWIEWLNTTPENLHGTGECFDGEKYCAMGGFLIANGYKFAEKRETDCTHPVVGYEDCMQVVPSSVLEAHDMTTEFAACVISKNDCARLTFKQIAEYVEGNA